MKNNYIIRYLRKIIQNLWNSSDPISTITSRKIPFNILLFMRIVFFFYTITINLI